MNEKKSGWKTKIYGQESEERKYKEWEWWQDKDTNNKIKKIRVERGSDERRVEEKRGRKLKKERKRR